MAQKRWFMYKRELCGRIGKSGSTIDRLVREGELKPQVKTKSGVVLGYDRADVARFLRKQRAKTRGKRRKER